jgi:hypothetical protein
MSNRNPVSITTLKNNKKAAYVVGFVFGSLIAFVMGLAGVGLAASAEKSSGQIGGAILAAIGIAGGIYMAILAHDELTARKNEKRCSPDLFNVYENVQIPEKYIAADAEYEVELDVPEYETGRKVQTKGYGGVFLKSNTAATSTGSSTGSNWDAIFIPGDAKAVVVKGNYTTAGKDKADRLYVMKKGVNKIIVKDTDRNKSPLPPKSPLPEGYVCPNPIEE